MARPSFSPSGSAAPVRRVSMLGRATRILFRLMLLLLLGALGAGGWFGWRYTRAFVYDSGYFTIRTVKLAAPAGSLSEELEHEAQGWLNDWIRKHGGNLVELDRERVAAGLRRGLPRAKSVQVEKIFPQTLRVVFQERTPRMVASLDQLYLIDEEGVLLAPVKPRELSRLGLPLLTGIQGTFFRPGDRVRNSRLGDVMSAVGFIERNDPLLKRRIVEWNLGGKDEVTAMLDTRTEVLFGDQAPLDLLDKLSSALQSQREQVRQELDKATYIDLRMENQIVYK